MSHCPPGCHVNFNISPFLFQRCSETNTQVQNVHSRSLRKALYNGYRRSTSCIGSDSLIRILDCLLVTGWKSVFYQSTKHTAEIKLSRHLRDCNMSDHFQNFSLAFFVDLKWNLGSSEPASSDSRTEQDVRRNARQVFLVPLLSCIGRRFLRALQQNRAHTRLLYLLSNSCKCPWLVKPFPALRVKENYQLC